MKTRFFSIGSLSLCRSHLRKAASVYVFFWIFTVRCMRHRSMDGSHSVSAICGAKTIAEAAANVPQGHDEESWKYLNAEAAALSRQGFEFVDHAAALSAVERYRSSSSGPGKIFRSTGP